MVSFFSTLFLGLIAAVIGATIQQRTWRHRSLVELKEKEYGEARSAVEALSMALDKRLAAQRTFTHVVVDGEFSCSQVDTYKAATAEWMGEYSTNKSKIYHSFGQSYVYEFEDRVQNALQLTSAIVSLGVRHGVENLSTKDKKLFRSSVRRLNFVQYDIYRFLNELNDRIKNGEIGRSKAINKLAENDLTMISRLYLVRRLFGIEGNIRRAYW